MFKPCGRIRLFALLAAWALTQFTSQALASNTHLRSMVHEVRQKKVKKAFEKPSAISGSFDTIRSTSLYDLNNGSKYDGMDYVGSLIWTLPWESSLATKVSFTQILSPTENDTTVLNDTHISYSQKKFKLIENDLAVNLAWNPTVTALIPLSKQSKEVEQLNTAVIGSASMTMDAGGRTALHGFSAKFSVSFGQNFHQFETDQNGSILNKYSSNQTLALKYKIKDWALSTTYINKVRWPYAGDVRNSFEFSQDVGYTFQKTWAVSLGHTNSGATLKPNGSDSNVALVDEENSRVYIGLSYGFGS